MGAVTAGVVLGAAAIGAAGTAYSANQAGKAAKTAAKGADAAAAEQARQFDISTNLTANQRTIGNQALNQLGARYGFNPAQGFANDTYDPFNVQGQGGGQGGRQGNVPLYHDQIKKLIDEGKSLDQILEIGYVAPNEDLRKVAQATGYSQSDLARLQGGVFSPEYQAQQRQARQSSAPQPAAPGQAVAPDVNLDRLRSLATNDAELQRLAESDPDLKRLAGPVDYSLGAFEASPDYQFKLNQGLKNTQASAAAAGSLYSGNALRALTEYSQGLASGEYNDFVNRAETKRGNEYNRRLGLLESDYTRALGLRESEFNRQLSADQTARSFSDSDFNRLATLAGVGNSATSQLNSTGVATAGNIGNALQNAGQARAAGAVNQANIVGQGVGALGQLAGYYYGQGNRGSGVSGFGNQDPYGVGRGSAVRFA